MMKHVLSGLLTRRQSLVLVLAVTAFLTCGKADAQVKVNGYHRSNGTYVPSHYRSKPNGNFHDNWSTKGNRNPYTGEWGTRVTPPSGYGSGGNSLSGGYSPLNSDLSGSISPSNAYHGDSSPWETNSTEGDATSGPRGPRPATLQESIETGAVDGQVVENPFVKPSRAKNIPRDRNVAR